ncbi:MAG: hypothetical protein Q8R33_00930 [Burkholderiales bacterium]|nr:hypothetical protein [Burkholderiales bacterium]
MPLPAWVAPMLQGPALTSVNAVPLTVHTPGVVDSNDTARPEVEVAIRAAVIVPSVWLPGEMKEMVWAAAATVKEFETTEAAAKDALPAWLALTVQVPAPASVSVVPLTVHTLAVVDAKDTARPELDVATSASGAVPKLWLPGDANVML